MATYRISGPGSAGYQVEATRAGGMRHVCGGLATQADAEMWIAAHKRAAEAEDRHGAEGGRGRRLVGETVDRIGQPRTVTRELTDTALDGQASCIA